MVFPDDSYSGILLVGLGLKGLHLHGRGKGLAYGLPMLPVIHRNLHDP